MVISKPQAHIQLAKEILFRVILQCHNQKRKHIRECVHFLLRVLFHDSHVLLLSLVEVALVCRVGHGNGAYRNPVAPNLPP